MLPVRHRFVKYGLWGLIFGVLGVAAVFPGGVLRAAPPPIQKSKAVTAVEPPGRRWALLIGVQGYEKAHKLLCTVADVKQLQHTLSTYGDYEEGNILLIHDEVENKQFRPYYASLKKAIPEFLKQVQPHDHLLVYFSGHGVKDAKDRLYLAPLDCDPRNPEGTGIAVEWFRDQLTQTSAKFKLLVLDACHSGSDKGEEKPVAGPGSQALGASFEGKSGVLTIASSTGEQASQVWPERQISLFSFWLNQGLRGQADAGGDGQITFEELFQYVHSNVTNSAKQSFPNEQEPVFLRGPSTTTATPTVLRLRPVGLDTVLADIAEQLATALVRKNVKKVGVLEFTGGDTGKRSLGEGLGVKGAYCRDQLHTMLRALGGTQFGMVEQTILQEALADFHPTGAFSVRDLGSLKARIRLAERAGRADAFILGNIEASGCYLRIECTAISTDDVVEIGYAGGAALLTPNEYLMGEQSVVEKPEDQTPLPVPQPPRIINPVVAVRPVEKPNTGNAKPPAPRAVLSKPREPESAPTAPPPLKPAQVADANKIGNWIQRLQRGEEHPMSDPNFPFRVAVRVIDNYGELFARADGTQYRCTECKPLFKGNRMYVGLRKDDVYELWLENRSEKHPSVYVRLLVDGLNTRPEQSSQLVMQKGMLVEARTAPEQYLAGARVNLDRASPWILDRGEATPIAGFYLTPAADSAYNEFRVVEAQHSLAARREFTKEIGLIHAAFYRYGSGPPTLSGSQLGTNFGNRHEGKVDLVEGAPPVGELLANIIIHYVSPEELESLR